MKYEDEINEIFNNNKDHEKSNNEFIDEFEEFFENSCAHESYQPQESGCIINFPENQDNHLYELSCFECTSEITMRVLENIQDIKNEVKILSESQKQIINTIDFLKKKKNSESENE